MTLTLLIIGHFVIGASAYLLARYNSRRDYGTWSIEQRNGTLFFASLPILNISPLLIEMFKFMTGVSNEESKW